jgi:hypothetical protein
MGLSYADVTTPNSPRGFHVWSYVLRIGSVAKSAARSALAIMPCSQMTMTRQNIGCALRPRAGADV